MMMRLFSLLFIAASVAPVVFADIVGWINEFHYRNWKLDRNLFIEVAGPKGEEAWEYFVVMYQGRDGLQFKQGLSLSGFYFEEGGAPDHGFIKYPIEHHGDIRNGKRGGDGIALVYRFECVQFLCYGNEDSETFMAMSGPCANITCENIGVHEGPKSDARHSLQLEGTGSRMNHFFWANATRMATPGLKNVNQEFMPVVE